MPNMDEVNLAFVAVGRCMDAFFLLFDLLIRTLSWLLCSLCSAAASLYVILSQSFLVDFWNFALFSLLTASEAFSSAAYGALHMVEGWLQALDGVFESFKMVGHLSCHVVWRVRDLLHRGLISGGCILRQTFEGLCIGLSLVLYFFNTVVNIVLLSMQMCVAGLAGVLEVVANPVNNVMELALTLLTFLYSCLVGASVLLWTSFQILLELLGGLGRVFFSVFKADSHGLLITAVFTSLALLLLRPRLPVLARRLSLLRNTLLRNVQMILEQSLANQDVQVEMRTRPAHIHFVSTDAPVDLPPENELRHTDSAQPKDLEEDSSANSDSTESTLADDGSPPKNGKLLGLLKKMKERKTCVICHDMTKTVLLLPCRHLCLCRHCADLLTQQQQVQQRSCPLCREPITQTIDVFL